MLPPSTSDNLDTLEDYDDLATWINDTLSFPGKDNGQDAVESLTQLDQQITHLIASLDIACEDTSSQLERIIDDVSRGVPRLTYDLHFIKDGAVSLQGVLSAVHARSRDAIPDDMNITLEQLKRLDTIKGHMEAAREVLREAESWSTLELEVTSFLTEQNYAKAASRLSEANKSMVVFQNTPEYDPRRTLLINLQNQLEASLSSALVAAINEQDLDICRNYFSIFSQIQREQEFRNYYNASRRGSLVTMWQDAQLIDCQPPGSAVPEQGQIFSEFLTRFCSQMLTLLNQERNSIPAIFPDPAFSLSSLISSVFSALHPTFPQRLDALFTHYGDSALKELIKVFRVIEEFANGVGKIMQKIQFSAVPTSPSEPPPGTEPPPSPAAPTHSRRRSMRMSISFRSAPTRSTSGRTGVPKVSSAMDGLDWDQELFKPFLEYQVDYGALERRLLDDNLREIVSKEAPSGTDHSRLIRERTIDIFSAAEESLSRYTAFTHGYGSVGLVQALDGFLKSFVDMWTADVSFASSSASVVQNAGSGDLSGLDYSNEDWTKFQATLHMLGSARNIHERMSTFELKLRASLTQTSMKFKDPVNFALNPSKGADQLLEQSTLNSAELHALLEKVDGELSHGRDMYPHSTLSARSGGTGDSLLVDARNAVFGFARACQISLETTIASPLRKLLESYASSSWMVQSDVKPKANANDLQVPSFSLSPSDVILRVTEGLLNLPQVFELHGDDDALAFSLHTLPNVDPELLKSLPEMQNAGDTAAAVGGHHRRQSLVVPKQIPPDPETVSSAWLSSIGQSLLTHLTSDVLPQIKRLTSAGTAQLTSDLSYLSNVARSLNLEHEALEKWKDCVDLDEATGKEKLDKGDGDYILEQVARMRGWW
ncbi:component of oligomeric golgi complex 7 [Moniliophthora roreri MCA 2997]|uniref:Conserved oligomeric Golgi complex subunit 7 n=2 Tax=Moniliophthora roreri TaxID=221103 RepID=V2XUP5_MONRO|nr:component of oligomeric golgi complex 7 [Moniliophthora roreri MCA 2997]KAI3618615.1 component of oligomeric golgi complex 7 [Moniliophthora roreri]